MHRKPPLRTYSKKNTLQPYVKLYKEPITDDTSRKILRLEETSQTDDFKENESINNSLDYDPFDTTFDRLLKSTRAQEQSPLISESKNDSATESSFICSSDETDTELPLPIAFHSYKDADEKPVDRGRLRAKKQNKRQIKVPRVKLNKTNTKIVHKKEKRPKVVKKKNKKQEEAEANVNIVHAIDVPSKSNTTENKMSCLKECSIQITKLSIGESSEKAYNAMISSTPLGRLKKSVMCNVSFSPIDGNKTSKNTMIKQLKPKQGISTNCSNDVSLSNESITGNSTRNNNTSKLSTLNQEKSNVLQVPSIVVHPTSSSSFGKDNNVTEIIVVNSPVACTKQRDVSCDIQSITESLKTANIENSNCSLILNNKSPDIAIQKTDKDDNNDTDIHNDVTHQQVRHDDSISVENASSLINASCSISDDNVNGNTKVSDVQCRNNDIRMCGQGELYSQLLGSNTEMDKSVSSSESCNNKIEDQCASRLSNESDNFSNGNLRGSEHSIRDIQASVKECKADSSLNHAIGEILSNTNEQTDQNNAEKFNIVEKSINTINQTLDSVDISGPCKAVKNGKSGECSILEPYILLTRLEDPARITVRRKRYHNWNLKLADITEDVDEIAKLPKIDENDIRPSNSNEPNANTLERISNTPLLIEDNVAEDDEHLLKTEDRSMSEPTRTLFLKPGKSWARSLSILNNVQNGANLNKLSIGKGKKWRSSVKDILDMQNQGTIQSCIKEQDVDKDLAPYQKTDNRQSAPVETIFTNRKSYNLCRFSKRISVRVVPDNKNEKIHDNAALLVSCSVTPQDTRESLTKLRKKNSVYNETKNSFIIDETPAKKVVLQQCNQEDYVSFMKCFPDEYLEHCCKIGEGVYGEVFLYDNEEQRSVIKIIPIEGDDLVNGEPQKKFSEILSEIVIAKELHNLRFNENYNTSGFVEVKNIKCVIGKYPERLIELWKNYDEEKNSDNDCPVMFTENQLYVVLELAHGGKDLEAFVFLTAEEAYFSFIQTAIALAVAEKALEFEHRDLHWGNILIARTDEQYVSYKFNGKDIVLPTKGVKISIIDFTLSRVSYQGCHIYNDLALDPALFTAQGEYQFEIYRLMRDTTGNNWQRFEPYTNVLWLHYTLDKMITAVRYKKKTTKIHKNAISKLKELKDDILSYDSASDFIVNSDKLSDVLYSSPTVPSTRTQKANRNK